MDTNLCGFISLAQCPLTIVPCPLFSQSFKDHDAERARTQEGAERGSIELYLHIEVGELEIDLLDLQRNVFRCRGMEHVHFFDMRELDDELDEFFDRFGARPHFFEDDDLSLFQNQEGLDIEHGAEDCLRLAPPHARHWSRPCPSPSR